MQGATNPSARMEEQPTPKLASTSHRRRYRRVVIRALKAEPANAGHVRPALLIAGEIARCWSTLFVVSGAPWVAVRRLRRCRLDFAKQRTDDHEKRKDWQAHRDLPNRLPRPALTLQELRYFTIATFGAFRFEAPAVHCQRAKSLTLQDSCSSGRKSPMRKENCRT
jgi:hypothetical protein